MAACTWAQLSPGNPENATAGFAVSPGCADRRPASLANLLRRLFFSIDGQPWQPEALATRRWRRPQADCRARRRRLLPPGPIADDIVALRSAIIPQSGLALMAATTGYRAAGAPPMSFGIASPTASAACCQLRSRDDGHERPFRRVGAERRRRGSSMSEATAWRTRIAPATWPTAFRRGAGGGPARPSCTWRAAPPRSTWRARPRSRSPPGAASLAAASVQPATHEPAICANRRRWWQYVSMTTSIESRLSAASSWCAVSCFRQPAHRFLLPRQRRRRQPVANRVEAGKQPLDSMSPTWCSKHSGSEAVLGSPGGSTISS